MTSSIPVPAQLSHLPLDERGYPVPVIVMRDANGKPHFSVNDDLARQRCFLGDLCSICGKALRRARWLVGGPRSAFHEAGAFADPPVHYPCLEYALQVCPYLAAPSYGKPVGMKQLERALKSDPTGSVVAHVVKERNDGIRPPLFVAVQYIGHSYSVDGLGRIRTLKPKRPYRQTQFWLQGERIDDAVGAAMAAEYVAQIGENGRP